jgi:ferric-dicitrate binding protein FerR (iron transport regulator)
MDLPINTVEELLTDESFLAWYFKTDTEAVEKWNNRIAHDTALRKLTEEAAGLLKTIKIKEQSVDAHRLKNAEQKLMEATAPAGHSRAEAKIISMQSRKINFKWWAAAAIILLSSLGIWQYIRITNTHAVQTAYGEIKDVTLPDGSQVMLNANTTINYRNWKQNSDREVWIRGEAFFHVKKTIQKNRFIVHTGNFDVIVTGTQFNVNNRHDKNTVLLKEGSVTVHSQAQDLHMKPGDYVEGSNTTLSRKDVNSAQVLAWTDRKFIFENTPMKEVASLVTEIYGIKVTLADEVTASSTITGIMPNDNLDVFLQSLEALSEYEVIKSEKEIQIRKK